jgi:hypothetical protein
MGTAMGCISAGSGTRREGRIEDADAPLVPVVGDCPTADWAAQSGMEGLVPAGRRGTEDGPVDGTQPQPPARSSQLFAGWPAATALGQGPKG